MQLVTWNTQMGCDRHGKVTPEHIAQKLQELGDCDVLCLQEVAVNALSLQGESQDQVAQLKALLPDWQIFFGAAVDVWVQGQRQQFGNLIATRLQVLHVQHYPLPQPVEHGVHSMPRMATVVTVQDSKLGPVRIMTTHLESASKRQRLSQANYLRRLHFESLSQYYAISQSVEDPLPIQTPPHTPYAVLCGDFSFEIGGNEYDTIASKAAVIDCLEAGWPESVVGARWNDAWQVLHSEQPVLEAASALSHEMVSETVSGEFIWVSDDLRSYVRDIEVDHRRQIMMTRLCA